MTPVSAALYIPPYFVIVFYLFVLSKTFSFPIFFLFFFFATFSFIFSCLVPFILFIFSFVFDFNGLVFYVLTSLNRFSTLRYVLLVHVKHTNMPN